MHLPLLKFAHVLEAIWKDPVMLCLENYLCGLLCVGKHLYNYLESGSDIIVFPFSAKKLAEELEGWLKASGVEKSPDVRGVIAP